VESLSEGGQGESVGCREGSWIVEIRQSDGTQGVLVETLDQIEELLSTFSSENKESFALVTRREKTEVERSAHKLWFGFPFAAFLTVCFRRRLKLNLKISAN
jgi:hypothetical protein